MAPTPINQTRLDGRLIAEANELTVLKAVRVYGHLRRSEIAALVWPTSTPRSAELMTQRTVRRMLDKQLLLERPNSLGGKSLLLAARGVARLKEQGLDAQEGYDLTSVAGPQFFHRTIGTCYLAERQRMGHDAYGEYALSKGWAPVGRSELGELFGKVPDGLVVVSGDSRGYAGPVLAADWVEVESSYKPDDELDRILNVAWKAGTWLNTAETVLLDRLVFVFDERQRHESAVTSALRRYLKSNPVEHVEAVLNSIVFARCTIGYPLVWHSMTEFSALDLFQASTS